MAAYEIIVTDVTSYGTLFCVAGWDRNLGQMVRPEPPTANVMNEASRFWDSLWAGPGRLFCVGNVVSFEALDPPPYFPYPHATEDCLVATGRPSQTLGQLTLQQVAAAVAPGVSLSLPAAFDGGLIHAPSGKAYVPIGHQGRSLGAIEIVPNHLDFYENTYDPNKRKLRARITAYGNIYDLSVTAVAARARWNAQGLPSLRAEAQNSQRIHVRLGLSRPFPAMPNECYVQINGLYFL